MPFGWTVVLNHKGHKNRKIHTCSIKIKKWTKFAGTNGERKWSISFSHLLEETILDNSWISSNDCRLSGFWSAWPILWRSRSGFVDLVLNYHIVNVMFIGLLLFFDSWFCRQSGKFCFACVIYWLKCHSA